MHSWKNGALLSNKLIFIGLLKNRHKLLNFCQLEPAAVGWLWPTEVRTLNQSRVPATRLPHISSFSLLPSCSHLPPSPSPACAPTRPCTHLQATVVARPPALCSCAQPPSSPGHRSPTSGHRPACPASPTTLASGPVPPPRR
jgi:hypothetical protein